MGLHFPNEEILQSQDVPAQEPPHAVPDAENPAGQRSAAGSIWAAAGNGHHRPGHLPAETPDGPCAHGSGAFDLFATVTLIGCAIDNAGPADNGSLRDDLCW